MNGMADRNGLEREGISHFRRSRRAAGNLFTHLDADGSDNITLFAVGILEQGQTRRTHRIIFDRRHGGFHSMFIALEIHDTDFLLMAAADTTSRNASVMVAPAGL